ncbi:MAG: hypothetical protein WDZ30_01575 [Cellvibrionaceae bacterium]
MLNKLYVSAFFGFAVTSSAKALQFFASEGSVNDQALEWTGIAGILAAGLLLGSFVWKARQLRCAEHHAFKGGEFIHLVFGKAIIISWFFTWLLLMFMAAFSKPLGTFLGAVTGEATLPLDFYLHFVVALMLLVFCATYFFMYRSGASMEED